MILILGRFQPLHNGHMKVFKDAAAEDPEIFIAIGSAGRSNEPNNPFNGEQRKEMIERALVDEGLPVNVFLIPNLPSDQGYVEHVILHIGEQPDKVITENPWTIDLFTKAGYNVHVTDRHFEISATQIRNRMMNNSEWENFVPKVVAEYIKEIDGVELVKTACKEETTVSQDAP